MRRFGLYCCFLLCAVLVLAACEQSAPPPTPTPTDSPTAEPTARPTREAEIVPTPFFGRDIPVSRNTSSIRVIHAASDAPALDLTLQSAPLMTSLGFGLAGNTITVIPGEYPLVAYARGTQDIVAETTVTLEAGGTTDVVVVPTSDGVQLLVLPGPARAVESGQSMVRAVNALSGAGALTVMLDVTDVRETLAAGAATELIQRAEGTVDLTFVADGAEIYANTMRLRPQMHTLFILTGIATRPQLLVFESPMLSLYSLRVVNLSTDAREIDVFFDDALVASDLPHQGITDRLTYATAPATLSVYAAGADLTISTPYLSGQRVSPTPGSTVTLAIYGPVADLRAAWIEQDMSPVPEGYSRVTFVHTVTDVATIRVGMNSSDLENMRPFGYGNVSTPMLFDERPARVFLRDTSVNGRIVELQEEATFPPGQSILYFVTGEPDGDRHPPVIYGDPVEVDSSLVAFPVETPSGIYNIRYINALASQVSIDIFRDLEPVVSDVQFATATSMFRLTQPSLQITANISGTQILLLDTRYELPSPGNYTIFIYGTPETGIDAMVQPDGVMSVGASIGTVRFVNLSQDQLSVFGLALQPIDMTVPTPLPTPTIEPTATVEGSDSESSGRARIRRGVLVTAQDIGSKQASRISGVSPNSQAYVINRIQEIMVDLSILPFAAGTHTDIIAFQYHTPTETLMIAFPVVYQPR